MRNAVSLCFLRRYHSPWQGTGRNGSPVLLAATPLGWNRASVMPSWRAGEGSMSLVQMPHIFTVLSKIYEIFLNKCVSICWMPSDIFQKLQISVVFPLLKFNNFHQLHLFHWGKDPLSSSWHHSRCDSCHFLLL